MTRKSSLSIALALTTLVTFSLVSISVRAGLFGLGGDGGSIQASAAQMAQTGELPPESIQPGADVPAGGTQRVETQYVYYDDGTYGPAPEANATGPDGSLSAVDAAGSPRMSTTPAPAPYSKTALEATPVGGQSVLPTPHLTQSPHPQEHVSQLQPTPTGIPNVLRQEPLDEPAPTLAHHDDEEPHETMEPRETEEPEHTQGPRETEEPQESPEPHDD